MIRNRKIPILLLIACLGLTACGQNTESATTSSSISTTSGSISTTNGSISTTNGSISTTNGSISTTNGSISTTNDAPTSATPSEQTSEPAPTQPATGTSESTGTSMSAGASVPTDTDVESEVELAPDTAEIGVAKIISYNCLTTSKAAVDYAAGRKGYTRGDVLRDFLNTNRPDSMGLQEITDDWEAYIESDILTYSYDCGITYSIAGLNSSKGIKLQSGSKEYSPILYRSDLYEVVAEGGEWFSDTPSTPSKYENVTDENGIYHNDMKFYRVYSYAVLKDLRTGEIAYIHVNCHFDHKSDDYVNVKCAEQLAEAASALGDEYSCPVVMTGDFNSNERTDCYAYLSGGENGFYDSKYLTENRSEKGTFPGYWQDFSEAAAGTPIDHVFVSAGNIRTVQMDVLANKYFSDHSAVMAILELNKEPDLIP